MTGRILIAPAIVAIALIFGIIFWDSGPPNPVYNGKRFSEWAELYAHSGPNEHPEAEIALNHIGTNAFPYMLKMLARKDSVAKQFAITFADAHPWIHIHWRLAIVDRETADFLFSIAGPKAQPAVPGLVKLLDDKDREIRSRALNILSSVGLGASNAVPVITRMLHDKDDSIAENAQRALGKIKPASLSKSPL